MTLVIELTPEEETRLRNLAEKRGLDAAECARRLVTEHLPLLETESEDADQHLVHVLQDYIGSFNFGDAHLSEDTSRKFAEHLAKNSGRGSHDAL